MIIECVHRKVTTHESQLEVHAWNVIVTNLSWHLHCSHALWDQRIVLPEWLCTPNSKLFLCHHCVPSLLWSPFAKELDACLTPVSLRHLLCFLFTSFWLQVHALSTGVKCHYVIHGCGTCVHVSKANWQQWYGVRRSVGKWSSFNSISFVYKAFCRIVQVCLWWAANSRYEAWYIKLYIARCSWHST